MAGGPRGERGWFAVLALSMALPVASYELYNVLPTSREMGNILPIGFALNGLIVTLIVFADLERAELQATVQKLVEEIAERRRVEQELLRSEEERRQLEMDRLRSELIANVSHELRTPIGLILLVSTMLLNQNNHLDSGTRAGHLRVIEDEARRLSELVDNLLDLAKIQSGSVRLNPQPMDLREQVRATLMSLEPRLRDRPVGCELPDQPLIALADAARVDQVLRNLLINAVKYSPPASPIGVRGERRGSEVVIEVRDCGIGIGPGDLPHIFERFYRAGNDVNTHTPGAGLGLPICKGLIEAHGGRLWAESRLGAGSTFAFALPAAETER